MTPRSPALGSQETALFCLFAPHRTHNMVTLSEALITHASATAGSNAIRVLVGNPPGYALS